MFRAMWRKAKADTRSHSLQSALIVIILVAASTALSLSLIVQQNADKPWRRAFDEANGAHVLFFGGSDSDDLAPITTSDEVAEADGPYPMLWNAPLINQGQKFDANVFGVNAEPPHVARPLIDEGRWLDAGATGEIVLERSYAEYLGVEVGETVDFKVGEGFVPLTVTGIAIDTGRGTYPDWSPGHAWVLPETLPALESDTTQRGTLLLVRLEDPEAAELFVRSALDSLGSREVINVIYWQQAQEDLTEWNRINSVFLGVFSAFALIAVGLIIANAISGRILAQYREIGILKATGFTPRQVAGVYLVQHLMLALISSLIGLMLALLIAPIYLDQLAETFNARAGDTFDPLLAILTVVIILIAVAIFTLLPAWRAGQVPAVQAITTGFTPAGTRPSRLAAVARRLRLPTPVVVGVKDAFARPWRAVLTVAALSLTIMTLTFALGIESMIDKMLDDRGLIEEPWDIEIVRTDADDATIRAILDANPNVTSYVSSIRMRAALPGADLRRGGGIDLRGLDGDIAASGYPLVDGRVPDGPGEAIVGRVLFDRLGLQIGDELTIDAVRDPFGEPQRSPLTLTVVGSYVEPEEDGEVILTTTETLTAVIPDLLPDTYEVMMRDDSGWDDLLVDIQAATNFGVDVDLRERGTPGEITMIRGIMVGLCGVLLVIGAANVLTTMLLNVRERIRDIGVLKAIGMTPRQVVGSVAAGTGLMTVLALVVGIPLGLVIFRVLFVVVAENMADADPALYAPPPLLGTALIVPAALVFAILCAILPARRAANVKVTDVLRHE
jgi:putative ABC transport system permease protein